MITYPSLANVSLVAGSSRSVFLSQLWFWICSLEQGAVKDYVEPSTTGGTRASVITPAWLMRSAAMTTSPSAPPVRLPSPRITTRTLQSWILSRVLCATENSCKGRCGEAFRRGRSCSCDPDCQEFKQCCSDFQTYCDAAGERSVWSASGGICPTGKSGLICACGVARDKTVNTSCLGNHHRGDEWSPQCYRASEEWFMP